MEIPEREEVSSVESTDARAPPSAGKFPHQLMRGHLSYMVCGWLSKLLFDHLKVGWIGKIFLESFIAEAQHFSCRQVFRGKRQSIDGVLGISAPFFRKRPTGL